MQWTFYLLNIAKLFGCEVDKLTSSAGYKQVINKPTHIVNRSSSRIDLIFHNDLNLILNRGLDLSIFEKFHYNIIFGRMKICICLLRAKFVKCGIIAGLMLNIYRKFFVPLIGIWLLKIFLLIQKSIFSMKHYYTFSEIKFNYWINLSTSWDK